MLAAQRLKRARAELELELEPTHAPVDASAMEHLRSQAPLALRQLSRKDQGGGEGRQAEALSKAPPPLPPPPSSRAPPSRTPLLGTPPPVQATTCHEL